MLGENAEVARLEAAAMDASERREDRPFFFGTLQVQEVLSEKLHAYLSEAELPWNKREGATQQFGGLSGVSYLNARLAQDGDHVWRTPEAVPALVTLGRALSSPELKGKMFMIGGHTDAKGGDEYNLDLSKRRAQAVERFLEQNFDLHAENFFVVGFGKEQLKNKADPFAAENRRVQIVTMADQAVASQ